ncbi:ABC transporter ATP-binding protein [Corynebacterium sp.]|uniref:ABC transporter ATP-binding protein n=1 Tax=Corynebacterium sp. TaxID=1720 RepID=UPI0026E07EC3|nr:ABC transporter ATP-binding protein [Corynebacterium sp.]MDO5511722.1 ABC transporter ATP-binding protein [Corynebacterium sp.]
MSAIVCDGVRREFGTTVALDSVSLRVEPHQIFGLLGPNGCGKTTLLNQIQGLDRPTSGTVTVLGMDPIKDHAALVHRLGSQHQESTSLPRLTVRETITLFASFYAQPRDPDELIEHLSLTEKADARVEDLSGGQRQRVFIALALLHDPELLLFDELTSALDPNIKRTVWDILTGLRADGHTILLTTHSMEEAHALCDRVAIMDRGRVLAEGTPAELVAEFTPGPALHIPREVSLSREQLLAVEGVREVHAHPETWTISGEGDLITCVAAALLQAGDSLQGLRQEEPTLEEVFVNLTGRAIEEEQS